MEYFWESGRDRGKYSTIEYISSGMSENKQSKEKPEPDSGRCIEYY